MNRFLFIYLFLVGGISISQNAWTQLGDFPIETRMSTAFSTSNFGYVLTSNDPNPPKLYQYNPVTDDWVQKADFLILFQGTNYRGASVVFNDEGYVLTGDVSDFSVTLWKYNETADLWEEATTEIFSGFGPFGFWGAAFANHGKIYVNTSGDTDNFKSYDPLTGIWETLTDYPDLIGERAQVGFSIGDRSYLVFSIDEFGGVPHRHLFEYDFTNDLWIIRTPYSGFIKDGFPTANFVIGDYAYFGMTYFEGNFWRYHAQSDTWQQIQANGYHGDNATGFSHNGLGYVGGGNTELEPGNFVLLEDVWKLDPELLSIVDEHIETFQISPNPARDLVFIHGVSTEVNYRIFNVQGRLLEKGISENKTINVAYLPRGMFLLSITSEEKTAVKKLLKL